MGAIATDDHSPEGAEEVRLRLAPKASNARLARLTVTALASRMAYSYDEIEDLRIAVGEVAGILFDGGDDAGGGPGPVGSAGSAPSTGSVEVVCTVSDEALTVRTSRSADRRPVEVTELSRQILESVADEVEIDRDAPSVTFTKRRRI